MEAILEKLNLRERTGTEDASVTNEIQEMEDRISAVEINIEEIDILVKENGKYKMFLLSLHILFFLP